MDPCDVAVALKSMKIWVDSREQDTLMARRRLRQMGCPHERKALSFGDYSACCDALDLSDSVAIERKLGLDELANCYCKDRPRFTREFERAKQAGAKLYLLVENGTWENAYAGKYRSRMAPSALTASLLTWLARYDCQLLFCAPTTSGALIRDILYRELKERLERMPDGRCE